MTKKIAVVAANGKAGKLIVKEAVQRDMDVTAFVRSENATVAQKAIVKDIMDLTAEDLFGFDAVVDAFGAWTPETLSQHSTTLEHLCDILSGSETRLLVVGGAGSLYVNPEHTLTVSEGPDFPEMFKPLASAMGVALADLRKRRRQLDLRQPCRRLPARRRAHGRIYPWWRGTDPERAR